MTISTAPVDAAAKRERSVGSTLNRSRGSIDTAGYFGSGLPYNRFGHGERVIVIFQGLLFENKPLTGAMARAFIGMYRFLQREYTAYIVTRRPHLPVGYSIRDMSDDYARTIREEFAFPVDIIGMSTGGSIALQFAADHPEMVRRLVIHSSAYRLGEVGKAGQLQLAAYARVGNWRSACALMLSFMVPPDRWYSTGSVWLGSLLMSLTAPKDSSDMITTIEAEDRFDFKGELAQIKAPTLVIAGDQDQFYSPVLFSDTARGIPDAQLILYPGAGHAPAGQQFSRDVLDFLRTDRG